jgi:crotonobetainyl-CoA:carnitine CoA-transferase CaiB-like acyl-CoA transferase
MSKHGYPLQGVRILDMATVLAAPFADTLCGDMGAEVVKLELPQGNDPLRGLAPVHERHALFWKTANRGKKGISLDVRQPAGFCAHLRGNERLHPAQRRAGRAAAAHELSAG